MAEISPARTAAFRILSRLHEKPDDQTPLPALLEESGKTLSLRDAALAAEIIYGVLRKEARLFAALRPFLARPEGLPLRLRLILAMAAFELAELHGIPARATLDQAVELARKTFGRGLSGLVNAVLRNACRAGAFVPSQNALAKSGRRNADQDADIALSGSLPLWLARLWREQYGGETAQRLALLSTLRPRPALRLNATRDKKSLSELRTSLTDAGAKFFSAEGCFLPLVNASPMKDPHAPAEALEQAEPPRSKDLMLFVTEAISRGLASRQGFASQRLAVSAAEKMRMMSGPFWDACCGRGGKSCALRERGIAPLLCSDPSERRLAFLRADAERLGLDRLEIITGGAQTIASAYPQAFSGILLDAPCSGTGTLARNPELRLRLSPQKLDAAARLQRELLRAAWTALRPGGLLVYATCAVNRTENEEQIAAFLARTSDARLEEQELVLPVAPEEEGQDILYHAFVRKDDMPPFACDISSGGGEPLQGG